MRIPLLTIFATGLAAVVNGQAFFTNTDYQNVKLGTPFTLTWKGDDTVCPPHFTFPSPLLSFPSPSNPPLVDKNKKKRNN